MICQWCHAPIEVDDVGKPCRGVTGRHRPDNRHTPFGDRCPCGRLAADHRVSHVPKGDPCNVCRLPASSHITRKSGRTAKTVAALKKRDGWKCQLCEKAFGDQPPSNPDNMSVEVDHVVPVWKGGGDDLDNLRLSHRICNMRRQAEELSPAQRHVREQAREQLALMLGKKGKLRPI